MITGFDCIVNEVCALLGSYTIQSGNYVPTLWDRQPISPIFKGPEVQEDFMTLKDGTNRSPQNVAMELQLYAV